MMHLSYLVSMVLLMPAAFDDQFLDATMRIDYYHTGDAEEEIVTLDRIYRQGIWAGNPARPIDGGVHGRYFIRVEDVATNRLIYSRGFDSVFGEYKTTAPAVAGVKRTYHETALIPWPRRPVRFILTKRDERNVHHPFFVQRIDPSATDIVREAPDGDKVFEIFRTGHPHKKVDIAFLGEGYTASEEAKFEKDVRRFGHELFQIEPFKSHRERFNIYGVFRPSAESGPDEPRKGVYRNTAINSTFNTFGVERYLLTEDNKSMRDMAANVPYDFIVVVVNCPRYGGGGIYRSFALFSTDSGDWEYHVFFHEFGHSLAGLADEYYGADVAYNKFFPTGVEPTEPNITALLDRDEVKWKPLLTAGVSVPTEWDKELYDGLNDEYQRLVGEKSEKLLEMRRAGASETEIDEREKEFDRAMEGVSDRIEKFLKESPVADTVGVFEGAGYSRHGLFRPMLNCLMLKFTDEDRRYCKVCEQAVLQAILDYSE